MKTNQELMTALQIYNKRKNYKDSTIEHDRQVLVNVANHSPAPLAKLDDEGWNTLMDEFQDSTTYYNQVVTIANKIREILGLKRIKRKFHREKKHPKLDLDKTEDDYQKILSVITNDRDRVIIDLMRYGGLRRGEVASLNVDGFKIFTDHVDIHFVHEKNGEEGNIRVIEPAALIAKYLDRIHRKPGNPAFTDDYHASAKGERLTSNAIWSIVKRLCLKANVTFHPHLFRHYRATELGDKGVNEVTMRNMFGWSDDSKMPAKYCNLSKERTKDIIGELSGIEPVKTSNDKPEKCGRCGTVIPRNEKYCPRCGLAINPVEALKTIERQQQIDIAGERMDTNAVMDVIRKLQEKIENLEDEIKKRN